MKIGRGNRNTRRKPAPAPLCPPQIPLDQSRVWTRAAALGSQRLTAWAMARPNLLLTIEDDSDRNSECICYNTASECVTYPPSHQLSRYFHHNSHLMTILETRCKNTVYLNSVMKSKISPSLLIVIGYCSHGLLLCSYAAELKTICYVIVHTKRTDETQSTFGRCVDYVWGMYVYDVFAPSSGLFARCRSNRWTMKRMSGTAGCVLNASSGMSMNTFDLTNWMSVS
jgi:hypothetical protein